MSKMLWENNKKWVYSITYDEGCADLLKYALPVHRKYGIPGHVSIVASQIGVPRNVPGSSYNGMMILSKEQIHGLVKEGWGMSCHGMTHVKINDSNVQYELYQSRKLLEEQLELPVTLFCLPNNNDHFPIVHAQASLAGYEAVLTIYDEINTMSTDLFRLCRCPIHEEYPPPFYSTFDPYKRIHQAIEAGGWIIDYCHCPMPGKPIHPQKDCTLEHLEERFKTVKDIGGRDVWLAEPNEVVKYLKSI